MNPSFFVCSNAQSRPTTHSSMNEMTMGEVWKLAVPTRMLDRTIWNGP
jgi:hypothetical protein